jgi:hypothetical protein
MPSGFQQDNNQLNPGLFRVVWVANTGTYPTADGNDNGGITPNSGDSFTTLPTTLVNAKARARGNIRFRNVINRLTGLADCQILDIETGIAGGGPELVGDDVATSLAFTVKYDRTAGIIDAQKALNVQETGVATNVATVAITTLALAIEDAVVRGFRDATTSTTRIVSSVPNNNQLSITVAAPDTAADILADITVVQIDGTELITLDAAAAAE